MFKLTKTHTHSRHDKDGKRRSYILYFLNDVLILKQKHPFDPKRERGYDSKSWINEVYLYNGCIYQVRTHYETRKARQVRFPVSKKKLIELSVPADVKIYEMKYEK